MSKLEKAGAILTRKRNEVEEVLLEYRARGYDDWTFPKGDMEKGETPKDTALRELREETGYNIEIIEKLPDIKYEFEENDQKCSVTQHMFLAEIIDGHLTPEFESDRLKWVSQEKAMQILTHQDLKDYLEKIRLSKV